MVYRNHVYRIVYRDPRSSLVIYIASEDVLSRKAHLTASSNSNAPADAGDTSPFARQNNAFALAESTVRAAVHAILDVLKSAESKYALAMLSSNATFMFLV